MNKNTFLKAMGILAKLFPEKNFANDIVFKFVENISDELFIKAIQNIIATQPKMDKSTNIIALIYDEVIKAMFLPASEAWGEVHHAALNCQMNQLTDACAIKTLETMGVDGYCIRYSENVDLLRNNFVKFYNELLAQKKREILSSLISFDSNFIKQLEKK